MVGKPARKKAEPVGVLSHEELEHLVREQLRAAWALKSTDIKKNLPKAHRSQYDEALVILRRLEERGEVFRWVKGSSEWFFASEPIMTLERAVRGALAAGPLPADALQQRVTSATRIPKPLFEEWKTKAIPQGVLFQLAPLAQSRAKRLALEPDIRVVLKKGIDELKKSLAWLDMKGVSRERIAQVLSEELGVTSAAVPALGLDRDAFLKALRALTKERPPGTLLSLRDVRGRLALEKARFDATALSLSRDGVIILHHHDHPGGLRDLERSQLVQDANGTSYIGVVLKTV